MHREKIHVLKSVHTHTSVLQLLCLVGLANTDIKTTTGIYYSRVDGKPLSSYYKNCEQPTSTKYSTVGTTSKNVLHYAMYCLFCAR